MRCAAQVIPHFAYLPELGDKKVVARLGRSLLRSHPSHPWDAARACRDGIAWHGMARHGIAPAPARYGTAWLCALNLCGLIE